MRSPIRIAPSILSADFTDLRQSINKVKGADWLHVDIMDNHFVPNLSFGPMIAQATAEVTDTPLDLHLMIDSPEHWIDDYTGYHNVTFHREALDSIDDAVMLADKIRDAGACAGVSIKPDTDVEQLFAVLEHFDTVLIMSVEPGFGGQKFMPSVLGKVELLRSEIDRRSLPAVIEIDGGINRETIVSAAQAGVDICVAGSSVFGHVDPDKEIETLRRIANDAIAEKKPDESTGL